MTTAKTCATLASYGVDFVDKDNTRSSFLSLCEQVADAGGADTYEHFDELRTGNVEERGISLASYCASNKCFTGSRRAHE